MKELTKILTSQNVCILSNIFYLFVNNQLDTLFQCIYLFHFSTCFEQPSAHHQENQIVLIRHLVHISLCR